MYRFVKLAVLAGIAVASAGVVLAQEEDESAEDKALEMRHGHMLNQAASMAVLGGMAQGNAEYDAAAAQIAADNLVHLASIHWDHFWLPGTAQGEVEDSAALPAIWENPDDFAAKHQALLDAATNLQAAAGTDLASLQAAIQPVGQACGGCHELYRAKEE